jgi:hypothetical protein
LADSAAVIWDALVEPATIDDLVDDFADAYGIAPADCEQDIRRAMHTLLEVGALMTVP